ncbi:tubby C-terminal-like domain-containing protein, partial [Ochromonadaceae sp. CCMP2298]
DLNRASSSYLGKLRSNDSGTEFRMFDSGINPKYHKGDEGLKDNAEEGTSGNISVTPVRCEMGFVRYSADALGSRQLVVALPGRNAFCYLINKPPRWNEQLKAHVLNFGGRITVASVYNFQLVEKEEKSTVVLQFGATVGKDKFAMDLRWPISPFQAFALSLSSFDTLVSKADI